MSCGCWKPNEDRRENWQRANSPQPRENGVIPLAAYPDCLQPHGGDHREDTAYIVGYNTAYEKVFPRARRYEAVKYRKRAADTRLKMDSVPVKHLCEAVVEDLYAMA